MFWGNNEGRGIIKNSHSGADPGFDQGGGPDRDRPKTAILGPQFCRILVLGPHFWWSGGARAPGPPPWIRPCHCSLLSQLTGILLTFFNACSLRNVDVCYQYFWMAVADINPKYLIERSGTNA